MNFFYIIFYCKYKNIEKVYTFIGMEFFFEFRKKNLYAYFY